MAEEEIIWPDGARQIEMLKSTSPLADAYCVLDEIPKAIEKTEQQITKIEKAVAQLKVEIAEVQAERDAHDEDDEGEQDYVARFKEGNGDEDTYDDYEYNDVEDFKRRRDDFAQGGAGAEVEGKQQIVNQLEDRLSEYRKKLEAFRESRIADHWNWGFDIPVMYIRLDGPWIAQNRKNLESLDSMDEPQKKKAAEVSSTTSTTQKNEAADVDVKYFVKIYSHNATPTVDTGRRRVFNSDAKEDRQALAPLIIEGEQLMKQQWRTLLQRATEGDVKVQAKALNEKEKLAVDSVMHMTGVLPLVRALIVEKKRSGCSPRWGAAFISPFCKNGTIIDAIKRIGGNREGFWFADDMVQANLRRTIRTFAFLEKKEIFHGAIKPTNVCVSDDGFCLMVSDFMPESAYRRYIVDLSQNLTERSEFAAPELLHAVTKQRVRSLPLLKRAVNLHKADVFSLGLVYYYIIMRLHPTGFNEDEKKIAAGLKQMEKEKHDPDLICLLKQMLQFNADNRPSFLGLLGFSERLGVNLGGIFAAVKELFFIDQTVLPWEQAPART